MVKITKKVEEKLAKKHAVSRKEIEECFANRTGRYLEDKRENHLTDPPTQWFIEETYNRRLLKVIFVFKNNTTHIKSAYEPNPTELAIYSRHAY